ncbi:DUF6153 family protein [Streptomyces gobitricini]
MSTDPHRRRVRLRACRGALLILAVLAGVFAMHGLAAGTIAPATAGHAPAEPGGHVTGHAHAEPAGHVAGDACDHVDESGGGAGHAQHADSTCAAGGVSGAPGQAPLLAATVPAAADPLLHARPGGATVPGRAPPDLAQLQLLRI